MYESCRIPALCPAGSLPDVWTQLTQLQALWLADNILSGSLPASYSALTGLTILKVHVRTSACVSAQG